MINYVIETWICFHILYNIFLNYCRSIIRSYLREFVISFFHIFQSSSLMSQNYSSSSPISVIVDDVLHVNDFREIFLT